jgi:hypothetical protein
MAFEQDGASAHINVCGAMCQLHSVQGALQAHEFLLPQFRCSGPLNAPQVPLSPPCDRKLKLLIICISEAPAATLTRHPGTFPTFPTSPHLITFPIFPKPLAKFPISCYTL